MDMREKFLKATGVKSELVTFDELGGMKLLVKQLSAKRFMELVGPEKGKDGDDLDTSLASVIVECVYDPKTGERFLTADDIAVMMEGSIEALQAVGKKVMDVNGIQGEEALRKN